LSKRFIYNLLVGVGIVSYYASLFSPLLSISEFYIFSDTLSFYSILRALFYGEEWLLFLVVFIFAFLLPSLKYMLLLIYGIFIQKLNPSNRLLIILEAISKWAMLDVFIIAIIISAIKMKALTSAQTHFGLYLFVIAVLIAIACTYYHKNELRDKV